MLLDRTPFPLEGISFFSSLIFSIFHGLQLRQQPIKNRKNALLEKNICRIFLIGMPFSPLFMRHVREEK